MAAKHIVVTRLAIALDTCDWAAATAVLDESCAYCIGDDVHHGPDAIIASYRRAHERAVQMFDCIEYESAVACQDDHCVIRYADHVEYGGHTHTHACEQDVWVSEAGLIVRIVHRDVPGERDALNRFLRRCGLPAR